MKLKNYLIAVDLDGTIVTDFDRYDSMSFNLLKELSIDNLVVIATGRPLRSSKYFYQLLDLKTPIINYNGALVHNPNDPSFPKQSHFIKKEDLCQLINDNSESIINVFCEIEDDIYLQKDTSHILPYLHAEGGNLYIGDLDKTMPSNPNGAILFSSLGSEETLEQYVAQKFNNTMRIRFWHADAIVVSEFYNPNISKASGLKHICAHYNIPHHKVIAIGDGHNDIEMLSFAHISVAMGNAHEALRSIAKFHTKTVEENGVYHFLTQFTP